MHEIEHLRQIVVAGAAPVPHHGIVTVGIKGKDVDIAAAEIIEMAALDERGACILYLAEGQWIEPIVFGADKFEMFGKPFAAMGYEAFIVGPGHRTVEIIVPGNESAVSHSPEKSAAADAVAQIMLAAYFVESYEYFEQTALQLFYIV